MHRTGLSQVIALAAVVHEAYPEDRADLAAKLTSYSDHQASGSGSASSAGMAMKYAEGVLEDLTRRLIDGAWSAQC